MAMAARILLVDDLEDIRETITIALEAAGYRVVSAADGEQALSILGGDPSFDLLMTDIVLGKRPNGFELAQRTVALHPHLKVLYTSGYSWSLEQQHAAVPGSRMLRKPYRGHELLREIDLLLDAPAPIIAAPDDAAQPLARRKPTILVVEDDQRSLGIAVELFEALGLKVLTAATAEDALMVLAHRPEIGALFTDIRLPGMSGEELAAQTLQMRPQLTVVLTSAYTDVSAVPGTRFIPKPWRKEDFTLVAGAVTRH